MTLIVAFRTYEGVLICADSQETLTSPLPNGYGNYCCRVDKIGLDHAGQYQFVIGGAGDADLVEGFTDRLTDAIRSWTEKYTELQIKEKIRDVIDEFKKREASGVSQVPEFLVCIKYGVGNDPILLKIGKSVRTVPEFALIGWDQSIYYHLADRFYPRQGDQRGTRNLNSTNRAIIVGAYLMMLGRSTTTQIGPPTVIVNIQSNFAREEDSASIVEIENRIESFSKILEQLTLWCPDADVPNHSFIGYLDNVEKDLMALREKYFGKTNRGIVHYWQPPDKEQGS